MHRILVAVSLLQNLKLIVLTVLWTLFSLLNSSTKTLSVIYLQKDRSRVWRFWNLPSPSIIVDALSLYAFLITIWVRLLKEESASFEKDSSEKKLLLQFITRVFNLNEENKQPCSRSYFLLVSRYKFGADYPWNTNLLAKNFIWFPKSFCIISLKALICRRLLPTTLST